MNKPIHVTGLGLVSAAGAGVGAALRALHDRIDSSTPFPSSGQPGEPSYRARQVPDTALTSIQSSPQSRRMARASQFAMAAAQEAFRSARYPLTEKAPLDSVGVVCASTHLSTSFGLEFHNGFLVEGKPTPGPIYFSNGCFNAAGSHISIEYRLRGCNHTLMGGMNAGLETIRFASRLLQDGPCTAIVCVATEELSGILLGAYSKFKLTPPVLFGEGGAAMLLETEDSVRSRNAPVLATLHATRSAHGSPLRHDVEGRTLARVLEAVSPDHSPDLMASAADGAALEKTEHAALRTLRWEDSCLLRVKPLLGEGFSFSSLAQAVLGIEELRSSSPSTLVAASQDRLGDTTAVSFRTSP